MNKSLITTMLAVATLASAGCATNSYGDRPTRHSGPYSGQYDGRCYPGERPNDCRERLRYEQRTNQRYIWRDGGYQRQDATGAVIASGIIGFILGAAIAGSDHDRDYYDAHKNDRSWQSRCASAHPGFDPRTGTYVGRDGYRHYCTR